MWLLGQIAHLYMRLLNCIFNFLALHTRVMESEIQVSYVEKSRFQFDILVCWLDRNFRYQVHCSLGFCVISDILFWWFNGLPLCRDTILSHVFLSVCLKCFSESVCQVWVNFQSYFLSLFKKRREFIELCRLVQTPTAVMMMSATVLTKVEKEEQLLACLRSCAEWTD